MGKLTTLATQDKNPLSDITVFSKYAKFLDHKNRRENWNEIVNRSMFMHQDKYPHMADGIQKLFEMVRAKKVLPSMRSLQFAGLPIAKSNNRVFNCAFLPIDDYHAFSEVMFLLLGGTGVGFSVQEHHVAKLPAIKAPKSRGEYRYQIQDSIVGFSDAIKVVIKAYMCDGHLPEFDYSDIREKGERLVTTGGSAPGHKPLKHCLEQMTKLFDDIIQRVNGQTVQRFPITIRPIEAHDICCLIADSVLAAGLRRSAMISLFDRWDEDMLEAKSGEWYITHPYRARANNSVVLPRDEVTEAEFMELVDRIEASGCGEPGVYWTNDIDWGTNPCCEIALEPFNFCNLVEINVGDVTSQEDLEQRVAVATAIGTLQASYTNFHYLRPIWRKTCEDSALLGVSMTGIASGACDNLDLKAAAEVAVRVNKEVAEAIGINPAYRITTIKPAGTTSLVLNTSSGIHAWHNDYYIRRMRVGKDEAIALHMLEVAPSLVEQDVMQPNQWVLSFPQKAPEGAKVRTESMGDLLERIARFNKEWVAPGHIKGANKHNVSCTVSVKEDEWEQLGRWLWDNRFIYNGISVLPYSGAVAYPQLPFEDVTKEVYESMLPAYHCIDVASIREVDGSAVDLAAELACAGGNCEVK